jgi:D-amino-acid oxidase
MSQCLANGVNIQRAIVAHILDAKNQHVNGKEADVIVNCTGSAARDLGGVEDKTVVPARGQTVLVRNTPGSMVGISSTDGEKDHMSYMMTRAGGS